MKIQNGVDIVAAARMEKSMQRPGFMARCFSPEEQAKEAFGKAMGVGLSGWAMPEAAVTYGETGAPYFALSGEAEKLAEGWQLALSLSHDGGYAIAMVTAYRPD